MATTIVVFTQQSRASGTYTSPSATYHGAGSAVFELLLSSGWGSFAGTIDLRTEQSFDGGTTWQTVDDHSFQGGVFGKGGQLPSGSFQVSDILGARLVRAVLTVNGGPVDIGVQATIDTTV